MESTILKIKVRVTSKWLDFYIKESSGMYQKMFKNKFALVNLDNFLTFEYNKEMTDFSPSGELLKLSKEERDYMFKDKKIEYRNFYDVEWFESRLSHNLFGQCEYFTESEFDGHSITNHYFIDVTDIMESEYFKNRLIHLKGEKQSYSELFLLAMMMQGNDEYESFADSLDEYGNSNYEFGEDKKNIEAVNCQYLARTQECM